ncbi:MAG: hypothetical protein DRH15_08100 [Deltaproteobacteria bacterium]|nr:MAG: hypothetical protein DRH15_08100 [Deltaproteobacteria bacterium]
MVGGAADEQIRRDLGGSDVQLISKIVLLRACDEAQKLGFGDFHLACSFHHRIHPETDRIRYCYLQHFSFVVTLQPV